MNEAQKREYDFFMRIAVLIESRLFELARMRQSAIIKTMVIEAESDLENARLWASRIDRGWVKVEKPILE